MFLILALLLGCLPLSAAAQTDFDIDENSVLQQYTGEGGDVPIHFESQWPELSVDWSGITVKTDAEYGTANGSLVALPASGMATSAGESFSGAFSVLNDDQVQDAGSRKVTVRFTVTDEGGLKGCTVDKEFSVTIAKASITSYQTSAPTATISATNEKNTKAKLKTALTLPDKVTVTYGGGTKEMGIFWADFTETFTPNGGSYTFRGTLARDANFNAYDTPLVATVTVTPVEEKKTSQILLAQAQEYGLLTQLGTPADLNKPLSRLDFAKLIVDLAGLEIDETDAALLTFEDCANLTDMEKATIYAVSQAGYLTAYEDDRFRPERYTYRREVAYSLYKVLKQSIGAPQSSGYFSDVPDGHWYSDGINGLYEAGIFTVEKNIFGLNSGAQVYDVLRWFVAAYEKKTKGAVGTISLTDAAESGASTLEKGEAMSLPAASSPAGMKYGWTSSDTTIAVVLNNNGVGRVFAMKAGTAVITAQLANGNSAFFTVTVTSNGAPDDPDETENTVTKSTLPDGGKQIIVTSPEGEQIAEIKLPADPGKGKQFEDVKPGAWFEGAVNSAAAYGLFDGTSETTFSPKGSMNRGMVAQVLYNLSGKSKYGTDAGNFTDVADGKWYTDAVNWAAKSGVVNGTTETSYAPKRNVTREQLVTILYRYAKLIGADTSASADLTRFPDNSRISNFAKEAMSWAVANGFVSGRLSGGKDYLAPKGTANRAEVATILIRFVEYLKK